MKTLCLSLRLALGGLVILCACRESKPLPPGNWVGRCAPNTDSDPAAHYGSPPTHYVIDNAKMFNTRFFDELDKGLSMFQKEYCHQLQVVSVTSLDGSTIEDYSLQYANRVGLGYRGLNNGVMLLLSPKTRQARIQIGCGLEDVISDAQAAEILQRDILPSFREGENEQGVRSGIRALMTLATKKEVANQFRPDGCRQ
jgi:uncharacterized membrane protein YgcG